LLLSSFFFPLPFPAINMKEKWIMKHKHRNTDNEVLNCGPHPQLRCSIADAVASATASDRNCGVILIHVYDRIVTT
jgi:hypothetical protein